MRKVDDLNALNIDGYAFKNDSLLDSKGLSRTGMWIIENLNNICVKKIEVNGESIAAIKVDIQKNVL